MAPKTYLDKAKDAIFIELFGKHGETTFPSSVICV
jgi:hypothetical protein